MAVETAQKILAALQSYADCYVIGVCTSSDGRDVIGPADTT